MLEELGVLGRGGFGVVKRLQETSGRQLAVKYFRGSGEPTSELLKRFETELAC
jgi:serine/threonine protein kinase